MEKKVTKKDERIKVDAKTDFTVSEDYAAMLDEMRQKEAGIVISKANMARICIVEAYKKRKAKKVK